MYEKHTRHSLSDTLSLTLSPPSTTIMVFGGCSWMPSTGVGVFLAAAAGAVRSWWSDTDGLHGLVDRRNLHGDGDLAGMADVRTVGSVAALTAVGREAVSNPIVVQQCVDALVPYGLMRWWASGEGWTGLVPRDAADDAQRALHAATVGD